jgi:hypothetical protein
MTAPLDPVLARLPAWACDLIATLVAAGARAEATPWSDWPGLPPACELRLALRGAPGGLVHPAARELVRRGHGAWSFDVEAQAMRTMVWREGATWP